MKKWNYALKHALKMYRDKQNYAYLYGANGEVGSDKLVDSLWKTYPSHYIAYVIDRGYTKQQLKDHVRGKICLDCSSFICYVTQEEEFEKLRVSRDFNSTMLRSRFAVTKTPVAGTAGSVLWKSGHVGLDIGYGMFLEFAAEFDDMRMREIVEANFVESGELDYMDYTGTNSR